MVFAFIQNSGLNEATRKVTIKTADLEKQRKIRSNSTIYNWHLINICEKYNSFFIIKLHKKINNKKIRLFYISKR